MDWSVKFFNNKFERNKVGKNRKFDRGKWKFIWDRLLGIVEVGNFILDDIVVGYYFSILVN